MTEADAKACLTRRTGAPPAFRIPRRRLLQSLYRRHRGQYAGHAGASHLVKGPGRCCSWLKAGRASWIRRPQGAGRTHRPDMADHPVCAAAHRVGAFTTFIRHPNGAQTTALSATATSVRISSHWLPCCASRYACTTWPPPSCSVPPCGTHSAPPIRRRDYQLAPLGRCTSKNLLHNYAAAGRQPFVCADNTKDY